MGSKRDYANGAEMPLMEKLIIGCGYLGRRVAARWLAQGHTVHAMTRDKATELRHLGIRPIVGNVLHLLDVDRLPPAETVLYAVAPDSRDRRARQDVWLKGLINAVLILASWPVRPRLLFIGSTSVYGQTEGEEVDEDAPTQPQEEAGQVLLEAQKVLESGFPDAVTLRFAAIYGPGRWLRKQAIEGDQPIMGDPDKWLNLIHVEDGADAVLAAEARARPGAIYNICDGHPVRRRDFYALMAQLLDAPQPRFVSPPTDAPLPPHEMASRRVSNRRMREELKMELRYPSYQEGLYASAPLV
jgi:nucleoside-diphosphate-sugar epimerase